MAARRRQRTKPPGDLTASDCGGDLDKDPVTAEHPCARPCPARGLGQPPGAGWHWCPDVISDGEVIEADAPRKLVQTWRMTMMPEMAAEAFTRLPYDSGSPSKWPAMMLPGG